MAFGVSQMFKAGFWAPEAPLLETKSPATFRHLFFDIVPNHFWKPFLETLRGFQNFETFLKNVKIQVH